MISGCKGIQNGKMGPTRVVKSFDEMSIKNGEEGRGQWVVRMKQR